ncbi:hypothetical protein MAR_013466 [Mya arenaria]|uniref:CCHC-type domain-containing protein n=1 Tax=Mya arenaria TaxID=6604 RepID=A0ABY7G371_MYAAR|nr:hypothetical protein MAR_013466 [Mya arenaria]
MTCTPNLLHSNVHAVHSAVQDNHDQQTLAYHHCRSSPQVPVLGEFSLAKGLNLACNKILSSDGCTFQSEIGTFRRLTTITAMLKTEWAVESARKKVRVEHSVSLKRPGNKKQYEFNWEVLDLVDSCDKAINLREADRAHQFIKEIKSKIENRNKIIRIADNSAAGWNTIAEYQLYDVASDSDDDKRIRKAEEKALVKMEQYRKQSASFVNNGPAGQPSSFRSFRGGRGSLAEERFVQCGTVICFKCGSEGHFASGCAADLQGTTNSLGVGRGRGVTRPVATATASQQTQQFFPANGGQ